MSIFSKVTHYLESRVRENRSHGSEGGGTGKPTGSSYPYAGRNLPSPSSSRHSKPSYSLRKPESPHAAKKHSAKAFVHFRLKHYIIFLQYWPVGCKVSGNLSERVFLFAGVDMTQSPKYSFQIRGCHHMVTYDLVAVKVVVFKDGINEKRCKY